MSTPPNSNRYLELVDSEEIIPQRLAALPDDAPSSDTPYDDELQAKLIEHGPPMLARGEPLEVPAGGDIVRYNTALWFALAHGLRYDWNGETFTIHPPS